MKSTFVLLLVCCGLARGQNAQLVQTTWHLTGVVRGGVSQTPPTDWTVADPKLTFQNPDGNYYLTTMFCNTVWAGPVTFDDENNTISYEFANATLGMCMNGSLNGFDQSYLMFYIVNAPVMELSYSIVPDGEHLSLTVTSASGDVSIYSSQELGAPAHRQNIIRAYPNPTTGTISIGTQAIGQPGWVTISNSLGQQLSAKRYNAIPQVFDLSALQTGLYFLSISTDQGKFLAKVVKE